MNPLLSLLMLLVLVVGCEPKSSTEAVSPSPLLTANSDRLWILARASRVGDGRECVEHYTLPDDPRYQRLAQKCDFWSRNYADYLRLNDFPTIEYQHLKDPAYWRWYEQKRSAISQCVTAVGNVSLRATSAERAEHTRRRRACNPYEDALYNQPDTPHADLGIRHR